MTASAPDEASTGIPDPESDSTEITPQKLEPVLTKLDPGEREIVVEVMRQQMSHSGPLPSPSTLKDYDEVLPGLAERIVRLTEGEQEHRHEIVEMALRRAARLRDRGQIMGMIALVLMLSFCIYLAAIGSPSIAGWVAVGLIAAVVGIFVIGKAGDRAEIDEPDEEV